MLMLAGCRSESVDQAILARDSAGVQIVENTATAEMDLAEWRLSDSTQLEIGNTQLSRAATPLRLSDGRVVVANAGTNELHFYDESGRLIRTVGQAGSEPGDFGALMWVARLAADSLVAWDSGNRRFHFFDDQGNFARSFDLVEWEDISFPLPIGFFDDGTLLAYGSVLFGPGAQGGLHRDSFPTFVFDEHGEPLAGLGPYIGDEIFFLMRGSQTRYADVIPFGRVSQWAVRGDRYYFGTSDRYEIGAYSRRGRLVRLIRRQYDRPPVAPEDISMYRRARMARTSDPYWREVIAQWLVASPYAQTMPAYGPFMVDADGNLWVRDYLTRDDGTAEWTVFDPEGRITATAETPPGLLSLDVGSDYVLGIWQDQMGAQSIRLYGLLKE
jgi:hypothetical protein